MPNVRIEFGKPLIGGHFNFYDFFLSIHRDRENPVIIDEQEIPVGVIEKEISEWKRGNINLQSLINTCLFKIRKAKYRL